MGYVVGLISNSTNSDFTSTTIGSDILSKITKISSNSLNENIANIVSSIKFGVEKLSDNEWKLNQFSQQERMVQEVKSGVRSVNNVKDVLSDIKNAIEHTLSPTLRDGFKGTIIINILFFMQLNILYKYIQY